jgi:cobalt-zinc-cadmium resistance protein CzcA
MIDAIIRFSLSKRLLTIFIVLLICLLGYFVYQSMTVDIYPDLNAPLVNIVTENRGMSSEDVERLITLPLESTLNGSPGVIRLRSESSTGISVVTVEFDWNTDVYRARQIVSGKLELVSGQLPAGTSPPILGPISSRLGEIFEFVLTSEKLNLMELRDLADWVVRYRLLGTPGVSYVVPLGGEVCEYQVLLNPEQLRSHDITVNDVVEAIAASNSNISGGILPQGQKEYLIRGLGQIGNDEDIREIVVAHRNGIPIKVKNLVTEVKIGPQFTRGTAGHNGKKAVKVLVEKQFRGNTLETIANVRATLDELKERDERLEFVDVYPYYDQSTFIGGATNSIQRAIIEGAVLITLVIILFMGNLRSALIAVLTIPYSIFIAVLMMWLFGITINVMSLGGLAIGIGKMANSSIFIVENIYRRLLINKNKPQEEQVSVLKITYEATKEIAPALLSANLIIFMVFVPMFFLQGLEGKMFAPTAFAVGMALIGSFAGAITIKPVLASLLLKRLRAKRENPVIRAADKAYTPLLQLAIRHRYVTVTATGIVTMALLVIVTPLTGTEFMPQMDEGAIVLSTMMLPETSLEESTRTGMEIEKLLCDEEKFPEVISITRETGRAEQSEHAHPVSHSHFMIELIPKEQRSRSFEQIAEAMRTELDKIPSLQSYIFEQPIQNKLAEMLTGTEGELSVKLFGQEIPTLNRKIREIYRELTQIQGAADIQIEQTEGVPRINIIQDRERMAVHGLRVDDVNAVVEAALNGLDVTDVLMGTKRRSILVRFDQQYRDDVAEIKDLPIDTPSGYRIRLEDIAEIDDKATGELEIFRENMERRKVILLNVSERDIGSFVDEARRRISQNIDLPPGYRVEFGGAYENQQRASQQLLLLSAIVAVTVVIILISSFGSVRQALLVLCNVPIALAGGVLGLWVSGGTINVSSVVGFIALFGISLQNAIILISTINSLRSQGQPLNEAVIEGARIRLRPILMTEMVMMMGALPLALSMTAGSEIHKPLAIVYIGGFLLAMAFSKFVLPALYYIVESLRKGEFNKKSEALPSS